jgi:hypothetical protein
VASARSMLRTEVNKKHSAGSSMAGGSEQTLVLSHDFPTDTACRKEGQCISPPLTTPPPDAIAVPPRRVNSVLGSDPVAAD